MHIDWQICSCARMHAVAQTCLCKCFLLTGLSWRADSSRRAFYKEFVKVVDAADVIIEVLDARDPLATRCTDVERYVRKRGAAKKLILLLNKIGEAPTPASHISCWTIIHACPSRGTMCLPATRACLLQHARTKMCFVAKLQTSGVHKVRAILSKFIPGFHLDVWGASECKRTRLDSLLVQTWCLGRPQRPG